MGSSIRVGMELLATLSGSRPQPSAVLLMLCDQPLLTADHLRELLRVQRETGQAAVASAYAGTMGVPVVFSSTLFNRLSQLNGAKGAGPLLASLRPDEVEQVDFPGGAIDVDTVEQYHQLCQLNWK